MEVSVTLRDTGARCCIVVEESDTVLTVKHKACEALWGATQGFPPPPASTSNATPRPEGLPALPQLGSNATAAAGDIPLTPGLTATAPTSPPPNAVADSSSGSSSTASSCHPLSARCLGVALWVKGQPESAGPLAPDACSVGSFHLEAGGELEVTRAFAKVRRPCRYCPNGVCGGGGGCAVLAMLLSPCGSLCLVGRSGGHGVDVWHTESAEAVLNLGGHRGDVAAMSAPPSFRCAATGDGSGAARVWCTSTWLCLQTIHIPGSTACTSIAISPCSSWLASASTTTPASLAVWECGAAGGSGVGEGGGGVGDPTAAATDVPAARLLHAEGSPAAVLSAAFSPCSGLLASGGADAAVTLWGAGVGVHPSGWAPRLRLACQGAVHLVVFSACSQYLVSGEASHGIRVWGAGSGECLHHMQGHRLGVRCCAVGPTSQLLVTGGDGGDSVCVWRLATGELLHRVPGGGGMPPAAGCYDRPQGICAVAVTPCGGCLFAAGDGVAVTPFLPLGDVARSAW